VTEDELDRKFETFLARDDDTLPASSFFEALAEIERRRTRETIEVTLRVVNGQAQFEPSDQVRAQGNILWLGDKRVVVKVQE
jgi:hypothetical protein